MIADIIKGSVRVIPWTLEDSGEWNDDTFYHDEQNLVAVDVRGTEGYITLVHNFYFLNEPERARAFAKKVEERGYIDSQYWGHHGYISLSLEDRFAEEAVAENCVRNGQVYNGPFRHYMSQEERGLG